MDGESQTQREARLRSLWGKLDTKNKGTLDYNALKNGLSGMNHRTYIQRAIFLWERSLGLRF